MGYFRAGFDVVGVDINQQPHYPFEFIKANVLDLGQDFLRGFDAIHASPPCQLYTRKAANWGRERKHFIEHPDLIEPTRNMLVESGLPIARHRVRRGSRNAAGRRGRPDIPETSITRSRPPSRSSLVNS
jgi:DNA (cytosine-5)-methyltransferase 1